MVHPTSTVNSKYRVIHSELKKNHDKSFDDNSSSDWMKHLRSGKKKLSAVIVSN
jgi:hypothetical protein